MFEFSNSELKIVGIIVFECWKTDLVSLYLLIGELVVVSMQTCHFLGKICSSELEFRCWQSSTLIARFGSNLISLYFPEKNISNSVFHFQKFKTKKKKVSKEQFANSG